MKRNSLYRLHTVVMQEIADYRFQGQYDFIMRVRYENDKYKFRYLNLWHEVEEKTLMEMCKNSNLSTSMVTKLKLKIV